MSEPRLGEFLVREGRLTAQQLERALEVQQLVGGRLGTNLLELGLVSEGILLKALGQLRATQTVDATDLHAAQLEVVRMIPAKLAMRYKLVPYLVKGKTIFIASKDPGDPLQEDEIGFLTSCMVRTCLATEVRLEIALRRLYLVGVDRRFLILGKRLAGSARVAVQETASAASAGPSVQPALPSALTETGSFVRQQPAPSGAPAGHPTGKPAADRPAAKVTPTEPPTAPPTEPQFIELDDHDLALLRRPAVPSDAPASPVAVQVPADEEATEAAEAEAWLESVTPEVVPVVEELDAEQRLLRASMALQDAEIRDEIGDALLQFAGAYYDRRILLISRRDRIFGWMGDGEGVTHEAVRGIGLEAHKPSVFFGLKEPTSFWLGPLPPLPSNQQVSQALGSSPKDCLVLPVTLRGKVVCYLYVDNGACGVSGSPIAELKRLVAKAGLAFEVYILKHKIRVL